MKHNIEVKQLADIKFVGITRIGDFDKIPLTFQQLIEWALAKGLLNVPQVKTATIYHDNPRITEMSKVRWSACLVIDDNVIVDTEGEIRHLSINKGRYAIGHFEIEVHLIDQGMDQAWEDVLGCVKSKGYEFGEQGYFELYYGDPKSHPEHKFVVDICVTIK